LQTCAWSELGRQEIGNRDSGSNTAESEQRCILPHGS
jgi:hypothetical protein